MPFFILDYERNLRGNRTIHLDSDECSAIPLKYNRLSLGFFEDANAVEEVVKKMEDHYEYCQQCCGNLHSEEEMLSSALSLS